MKRVIYNQGINQALTVSLGLVYTAILYIVVLSLNTEGFRVVSEITWVEIVSLGIFLSSIVIGSLNMRFYAVILIFVVLALPASFDNLLPSVLISASADVKDVYFPLITHVDIYLIFGIIRFWNLNEKHATSQKTSKTLLFLLITLGLLFLSLVINMLSHFNYFDSGLILSHSFHFRYIVLLLILFYNTNISLKRHYFLYGIVLSIVFLLIEASYFSIFIMKGSRLLSGSLKLNTFANILCALSCYFSYLLLRKKLGYRYLFLLIALLIGVFMNKTRSAMFIYVLYLIFESINYIVDRKNRKIMKAGMILGVSAVLLILSFSINERYALTNLGLKQIDFSKTHLTEIIQFQKNDFNESMILRLHHYQTSLNMIKSAPIIGIGAGRWNRYKADFGSSNKEIMDSHNDVLAFASQYGIIIGLAFLFSIYLIPFVNSRKLSYKIHNQDDFLKYLFIINIVMIFAGITNAGLFKHQVFGFLSIITVLSFYVGDKKRILK